MSSEEHSPLNLVENARRAEQVGFEFALISDHFHPWVSNQGNSPFVWSVIGGISQATEHLRLGTGVTCPTMRIHPAIIAHAASTAAAMMPGRFFLGLGTGENLNEHVLGDKWPNSDERLEMLEEAIEIIRLLWEGGEKSFSGDYYTVEDAQLFTLPEQAPPIYVAATGPEALELAANVADGLITTDADEETIDTFREAGGDGKPKFVKLNVCWAESEAEARQTYQQWWPTTGISARFHADLPTPSHFEDAVELMKGQIEISPEIPLGPDIDKHLEMFQKVSKLGFDHLYIHQIGPEQEGFFKFYEKQIIPELAGQGLIEHEFAR